MKTIKIFILLIIAGNAYAQNESETLKKLNGQYGPIRDYEYFDAFLDSIAFTTDGIVVSPILSDEIVTIMEWKDIKSIYYVQQQNEIYKDRKSNNIYIVPGTKFGEDESKMRRNTFIIDTDKDANGFIKTLRHMAELKGAKLVSENLDIASANETELIEWLDTKLASIVPQKSYTEITSQSIKADYLGYSYTSGDIETINWKDITFIDTDDFYRLKDITVYSYYNDKKDISDSDKWPSIFFGFARNPAIMEKFGEALKRVAKLKGLKLAKDQEKAKKMKP